MLIPIDELHQPLQLPDELLAQPLVLNATGEVNPAAQQRPAVGLLRVGSPQPCFTEITAYSELQETLKDHQVQLLREQPIWGLNP